MIYPSCTSVGANIREAFYGHGKADFIAELQIALKECLEINELDEKNPRIQRAASKFLEIRKRNEIAV